MNIHQTVCHGRFLQSIGWTIEKRVMSGTTVYAFIRKLPFLPLSLMKLQRVDPELIDWQWVKQLECKHHVYETLIELNSTGLDVLPLNNDILTQGFAAAKDYMLNTKTRLVDLTRSEQELKEDLKPKTRYNLHLAEKYRLQTHIWTARQVVHDPELFSSVYQLLRINAKRINMLLLPKKWIHSQLSAFGDEGFVVGVMRGDGAMGRWGVREGSENSENSENPPFAKGFGGAQQGVPPSPKASEGHSREFERKGEGGGLEAGAVFYCSKDTCSYNHNGSTAAGRKMMAPTLAVWAGMMEGKRRGLPLFDFDGIFDERFPKQHRFKGFGRFKSGFGGNEVYFPPMYRKYRNPFLSS